MPVVVDLVGVAAKDVVMVFVVVVVGTRVVAGTVVMPVVVGPCVVPANRRCHGLRCCRYRGHARGGWTCVVPANDVVMVFVVVAGA